MSLHKIDLNLFRVFEAVLRQGSVTAASRDLRVTPSAVSHALARLRQALGDELFIAGEAGMVPTPRALELAPGIRNGLNSLAAAVGAPAFNPAAAIRTFRLAASDYVAALVLPPLMTHLAAVAPQVDLRVFPANRIDVVRTLDEGRLDLLIGWFDDLPGRLRRTALFREREALLVRRGHPLADGPVNRQRLLDFPHIVVELTGTEGQGTDGFLDERGALRRVWIERLLLEMSDGADGLIGRVAASVPHFSLVPAMLQHSDLVATFPWRLARQLLATAAAPLVMLDPPGQAIEVDVAVVWHQRSDADPGSRWFIDQLAGLIPEPLPAAIAAIAAV